MPATALVVDGDPVSRRFVELALGKAGEFGVEAAEGAAAAMEILRVQTVELIIADTDLPDANGLHFYRALSQESRLRGIPFVFLSADRRPEARMAVGRQEHERDAAQPALLAQRAVEVQAIG